MTKPAAAATRHVVERCPSCGVEHDVSADSICEACDTPLRAWCRAHSRETGWLDEPRCPHCFRDAVRRRRTSTPRAKPKSSTRRPRVMPAPPLAPATSAVSSAPAPSPGPGGLLPPPEPASDKLFADPDVRRTLLLFACGGLFGWLLVATDAQAWWTVVMGVYVVLVLFLNRHYP